RRVVSSNSRSAVINSCWRIAAITASASLSGVHGFLSKPCTPERLADAVMAAIRQHELITAERELLETTLRGSVKVLTEILALADPRAFGFAEMLRDNMRRLAEAMNVKETWELEVAAMLSGIGIVTIPPEVLLRSRE